MDIEDLYFGIILLTTVLGAPIAIFLFSPNNVTKSQPENNNSVTTVETTANNNNRQNIYQIVAFIGGMATVTTFEMLVKPKTRNKN